MIWPFGTARVDYLAEPARVAFLGLAAVSTEHAALGPVSVNSQTLIQIAAYANIMAWQLANDGDIPVAGSRLPYGQALLGSGAALDICLAIHSAAQDCFDSVESNSMTLIVDEPLVGPSTPYDIVGPFADLARLESPGNYAAPWSSLCGAVAAGGVELGLPEFGPFAMSPAEIEDRASDVRFRVLGPTALGVAAVGAGIWYFASR